MAADSRDVLHAQFRALSRIQADRRIERVGTQSEGKWDNKSTAGEGLKQGW